MEIGIIGFGNFGKFMAGHLSKVKNVNLVVTDVINKNEEANKLGIKFVSFEELLERKIIILAVPMENFKETLLKIKDNLLEESIIIDICSLKMFSCELMEKILPNNVKIIGAHPLFGPQSAQNSVNGMKIALCNVRSKEETFNHIIKFCESLGLKVIITTPEEHDRQMAISQALTHFIGQALFKAGIKRVDQSTKTFDKLMDIVEIIGNDTPALFNNMQIMNPFAGEVRQKFLNELNKINLELEEIK